MHSMPRCPVSSLITCVSAGVGLLAAGERLRRRQELDCPEPTGEPGLEAVPGGGGGAVVSGGGGPRPVDALPPGWRCRRVSALQKNTYQGPEKNLTTSGSRHAKTLERWFKEFLLNSIFIYNFGHIIKMFANIHVCLQILPKLSGIIASR